MSRTHRNERAFLSFLAERAAEFFRGAGASALSGVGVNQEPARGAPAGAPTGKPFHLELAELDELDELDELAELDCN